MADLNSAVRPEKEIDPAFITRLTQMGGDQLVQQLIQMYLDRSVVLLEQIRTGTESLDYEIVKNAAHSLISSAGNLGGQLVSHLSKLIESAAIEQELASLKDLLPDLLSSQEGFVDYLKLALEQK